MNSDDLVGFAGWEAWSKNAPSQAPQKPGVYVFRLAGGKTFRRLKEESDIVYIGSTKCSKKGVSTVRQRLRQHLRSREEEIDTGYRIERVQNEIGSLQVTWKTFDTHDASQFHEAELLRRYARDHIELPPLNRQESGKKVWRAIRRLESLASDQRDKILKEFRQGGASTLPETRHRTQRFSP
ncbi:MAG: hypothetical protein ACE5JX_03660 [Acidobacteriota bacterium]